jgi:hypothetical protein
MHGRELTGTTAWREHANVLDVAEEVDTIMLGAILSGDGELRLSGLAFERVDERVPVTGPVLPRRPRNLDFRETWAALSWPAETPHRRSRGWSTPIWDGPGCWSAGCAWGR